MTDAGDAEEVKRDPEYTDVKSASATHDPLSPTPSMYRYCPPWVRLEVSRRIAEKLPVEVFMTWRLLYEHSGIEKYATNELEL
jgi:hypothetical protein